MKYPIKFTTRLEPKEAFHFFFYGTFFRNFLYVPFLLIVGFGLACFTVSSSNISDPLAYVTIWLFFTPLLSLGVLFSVLKMASRAKKKKGEAMFYEPVEMMLYRNRLRLSYPGQKNLNLPYENITRTLETKKYYIIYIKKNVLFIRKLDVPNQETMDFLRETLKPRKLFFR